MKFLGQWELNLCPICMTEVETTHHVLFCWHPHQSVLVAVQSPQPPYLAPGNMHPDIIACFSKLSTRGGSTFTSVATPSCLQAAQPQDSICLHSFFPGQISTHWLQLHVSHYQTNHWSHSWSKCLCQNLLWTDVDNIPFVVRRTN